MRMGELSSLDSGEPVESLSLSVQGSGVLPENTGAIL